MIDKVTDFWRVMVWPFSLEEVVFLSFNTNLNLQRHKNDTLMVKLTFLYFDFYIMILWTFIISYFTLVHNKESKDFFFQYERRFCPIKLGSISPATFISGAQQRIKKIFPPSKWADYWSHKTSSTLHSKPMKVSDHLNIDFARFLDFSVGFFSGCSNSMVFVWFFSLHFIPFCLSFILMLRSIYAQNQPTAWWQKGVN